MVEVDALTAARRARQRRKKELQRHGQAVLRRVLGVALLSAAASANAMNSTYPTQLSSGGGSFPSLVPAEVHDAYETYSKFKYGTQTLDDGDLSHPTAKFSSKPGGTGKLAGTSCDLGHNNKDQRHHPNYTRAYHLADQPPWASNSITKLKALGKVPVGHGENAHSMCQLGDASSLTSHSVLPSTYMQPPRYNQLSIPGSTSFTASRICTSRSLFMYAALSFSSSSRISCTHSRVGATGLCTQRPPDASLMTVIRTGTLTLTTPWI